MAESESRSAEIKRYNSAIKESEVFLFVARDSGLQRQACRRLQSLLSELRINKKIAVDARDEDFANLLLGFECVATCLEAEINMWLLLKSEEPEKAWDYLVSAQMAAADAARAHSGFRHLLHQAERLEAIERLTFPPQVFVSAGMIVRRQECSICGGEYGDCGHLVGMPYWGEFCHIIARDVELNHVSIVVNPADKRCRVFRFSDEGGERNRMTWKVEPPQMTDPDKGDSVGNKSHNAEMIFHASGR